LPQPSPSKTASGSTATREFQADEQFARHIDEIDPLRPWREEFLVPRAKSGEEVIYFCGNSLGLQPKRARTYIEQELKDWGALAVDAHFEGATPWYSYHEVFRETGARLVGALPGAGAGAGEVVMMNSLTVNLHLMMVSFFQPTKSRYRILIEDPCFPSDIYAVKTHLRSRGLDPDEALIIARPRCDEQTLREEDIESLLETQGESIALLLLGGVNFFTGQALDMQRIAAAGHRHGCMIGFDLAHAAGNIPLALHDWQVDFACWCSYKYLNAGPGAIAGCFVHERHGRNLDLPRLGGWWGNDPATRFKMHLIPEFVPRAGAEGWQVSNPSIFAMAPLRASLDIFDQVGMTALLTKSLQLTGYLRWLIGQAPAEWFQIITPDSDASHGAQLSLLVHDHPRERLRALQSEGVVCDFREPNVIRVAPVPLYNTFHEVWRFARILAQRI
jgi:kynureninase